MRIFTRIAGIDPTVLFGMERCLHAVNTEQIEQLARAFNCSPLEVEGLEAYAFSNRNTVST